MPERNDRKHDERLVQRDRRRRHSLKSRNRSGMPTFSLCSIFFFSRSNFLVENKSSLLTRAQKQSLCWHFGFGILKQDSQFWI